MNKREILSFVSYANTWPQRFVQRRFFLAVFVERHVKLYELADALPFLSLNQLLIVVNVFENSKRNLKG